MIPDLRDIGGYFLDKFVDNLIADIKVQNKTQDIEPAVLARMKEDYRERIDELIYAAILDTLSRRKVKKYEKLMDNDDDMKIQSFLRKNVANIDKLVTKVLLDFRRLYIKEG